MTDLIERMKEALIRFEGLVLDRDEDAMPFLGADARTLLPKAMKEIEELRKEGFYLSAGQCLFDGGVGLTAGDGGHAYCAMQARAEAAEAKLAKVKAAFRINMMRLVPDYSHEAFDADMAEMTGEKP